MSPGSIRICLKARLISTLKISAEGPNSLSVHIMESIDG